MVFTHTMQKTAGIYLLAVFCCSNNQMKGVFKMVEKKASTKKTTAKKKTTTKKNKGGRPTKMTSEMIQKLEHGFLMGLSDRKCCAYANISPATLYDYCVKHPEFSERKELLKESPTIQAQINVVTAINNGDEDMSKWYLERKCKEEFSIKQDIAVTGEINNPMEGLTTEELKKLIADD